ncbi:hypothetical protein Tsp_06694 [Trichinella spiralis]|uniref:hypothetical protein n=1 Tax=Trichinella spiralis TaxID=6334 RepID=UPI0001EFBFEA|nr:hypothetical protein Tsp_06694 [Trichinella spiralis]
MSSKGKLSLDRLVLVHPRMQVDKLYFTILLTAYSAVWNRKRSCACSAINFQSIIIVLVQPHLRKTLFYTSLIYDIILFVIDSGFDLQRIQGSVVVQQLL